MKKTKIERMTKFKKKYCKIKYGRTKKKMKTKKKKIRNTEIMFR